PCRCHVWAGVASLKKTRRPGEQCLNRQIYKEEIDMTVRHRIGSTLTLLPVFLLLANTLQAQQCSTATTAGRYVVACGGYLSTGPAGPLVPAKILGTA